MKKVNKGFTNIATIPTEESLSAEGIKEIIRQSIHLDETDPPFLYFFKVPKVTTHFLLSSIPIRRGLFLIGYIEIAIALYAFICLLEGFNSYLMLMYRLIQMLGGIQGVMCVIAANKFRVSLAKICYHWKAWEVVILDSIEIFIVMKASELQTAYLHDSIRCVLRAVYGFYVAYVIYSFVLLIERKGNANLVIHGPNLVKLMENIKKQAAAMENKTELTPEAEMSISEVKPDDNNF